MSLASQFNAVATDEKPRVLSATEQFLVNEGVTYRRDKDGTLYVPGDLDISNRGSDRLPDLRNVVIAGSFNCSKNNLSSLWGGPLKVGRGYFCYDNDLVSLEHAPRHVPGDFSCTGNRLETLEHAPQSVGGVVTCHGNPLKNLEGGPEKFGQLKTDFGNFASWEEVPDHLAPKTKARVAETRRAEIKAMAEQMTKLPAKVRAPRTARFRPKDKDRDGGGKKG